MTIGVVGFDWGFRPAIALTNVPRPAPEEEEEEEENPCRVGTALELAVSGLVSCGCIGAGSDWAEIQNLIVPAIFNFTGPSTGPWSATGGSGDIYIGASCVELDLYAAGEVCLTLSCDVNGFVISGGLCHSGGAITVGVAGVIEMDVPMSNSITCGGGYLLGDGTFTLSIP